VRPLVRSSHERWDGGGYPDGLAGEEIPLGARIIAVCDSYHAMIEDRPYRPALSGSDACAELLRAAGAQLDPRCVEAFLELLAERERSATAAIHYWPERDRFALNGGASSSQRAAAG
ncbi:MAG TPA: HD domain-containing phosphohydrolase, partial [Thermoleophilaceae bacterium]|nr:HD domain-containing phosphohydrolase [Thermoleophilaceae bacterium]